MYYKIDTVLSRCITAVIYNVVSKIYGSMDNIRNKTMYHIIWFRHVCLDNQMFEIWQTRFSLFNFVILSRRAWRYQRGNQNPYIEEEQATQWPKGKVQKDKQRSAKHTHKTKDRVTRTPLKTGGELRCSGRVGIFCSTSDTLLTAWYIRISLFLQDKVTLWHLKLYFPSGCGRTF
jgi:hypothetical protein